MIIGEITMVKWTWLKHTVVIHGSNFKEVKSAFEQFEKDFPNHQLKFSNVDDSDDGCRAIYWR